MKEKRKMENRAGLADRAQFEAFSRQWLEPALKEAERRCSREDARPLLAVAVLTELRKKYAYVTPPANMDYDIREKTNAVFRLTGQNPLLLEYYLESHAFLDAPAAEKPAPEPAAEKPAPEPAAEKPAPEPAAEKPAPEPAAEKPAPEPAAEKPAPEPAAEKPAPEPAAEKPAPEPAAEKPAPEPAAEKPAPEPAAEEPTPEPAAERVPDTFLDPVRTTLWTPDSERSGHVVQEIVLPDDDEEIERSESLSFVNAVLFLLVMAAFLFCFFETGFLQYLLN